MQRYTRRVLPTILSKQWIHTKTRPFSTLQPLLHKHHAGCSHDHHHHHGETCTHEHHHEPIQQPQQSQPPKIELEDSEISYGDAINLNELTEQQIEANFAAIQETVESTRDHSEVYLLGLQIKGQEMSRLYFTLHALNMELAQVKSKTRRNPSMGSLRLNWWKSGISSAIKGFPPRVPVLICLAVLARDNPTAIVNHRFRNLITWRITDLKWRQAPTLDLLEQYAHNIYSTLLYVMLNTSNLSTIHTDHVAAHLGKAYGLCTLLRGTPYHAENNETYLPAELCAKFGLEESDIYTGKNSPALENVVFEIADLAKGHLDNARSFATNSETPIPKEAYPIFYPAIVCDVYLKELEKANFNIFDPNLQPQKLRMKVTWAIMKTGWFGKY